MIYFLNFVLHLKILYGTDHCTANMHMHNHLKDSILDYSFWLFSFERYNGILGSIPSNNRSIEAQLMHRFMSEQQLHSPSLITMLEVSKASNILSNFHVNKGSVAQQINSCDTDFKVLGIVTECVLDTENVEMLSSACGYSTEPEFVKCLRSYKKKLMQ